MKLTAEQWIPWIGATLVATMAYTAFAFQTFETRDHANESKSQMMKNVDENKGDIVQRLVRMEDKMDRLIKER